MPKKNKIRSGKAVSQQSATPHNRGGEDRSLGSIGTTTTRTTTVNGKDRMNEVIGDIGYTFVKFFPGHGYFRGTVVKIRPNAGT